MSAAPPRPGLRRAGPDDALCLSVLASQVFLDTYATEGIDTALAREVTEVLGLPAFEARLLQPGVEIWLAELESHVVGFVDLDAGTRCPVPLPQAVQPSLEVLRLYVQAPFQRRGIGRLMLEHAARRAREAGCGALWLTAWVGNTAARAFYAHEGWADVGSTAYVIDAQAYENRVLVKTLA